MVLMPGYIGISDFIWANTGLTVEARAVSFANIQSEQPVLAVQGLESAWHKLDALITAP